jgi:hypothetical protein
MLTTLRHNPQSPLVQWLTTGGGARRRKLLIIKVLPVFRVEQSTVS